MGEIQGEEEPFRPVWLFYPGSDDRRARQERARERQIATRVSRAREHGGRPGGAGPGD